VRETVPTPVEIPFSAETTRLFQYTAEEANGLQHQNIGIAHLLLGILRDERSLATSVLRPKGVRLHTVRDELVQLLNEEPL
jgi:ATP-dependent Clp protease ATP-binding subunit ClpC